MPRSASKVPDQAEKSNEKVPINDEESVYVGNVEGQVRFFNVSNVANNDDPFHLCRCSSSTLPIVRASCVPTVQEEVACVLCCWVVDPSGLVVVVVVVVVDCCWVLFVVDPAGAGALGFTTTSFGPTEPEGTTLVGTCAGVALWVV